MNALNIPEQKAEITKVRDELIAVYERFAAYRIEKEQEFDYANNCYLIEAERSCKLQHEVDSLQTEICALRNQIDANKKRSTIENLQKIIDTVENKLIVTQGTLVKEINNNEKKDTQFKKMKHNWNKLKKTLIGELKEKESLVATICELDKMVGTWKTKYEKCKEQCMQSGSDIYESNILRSARNSGVKFSPEQRKFDSIEIANSTNMSITSKT